MQATTELIKISPRKSIKVLTTPRGGVCALDGKVALSVDYSGQEIRTGAAASGDEVMVNSLLSPKTITLSGGRIVKNPDSDIHTLTACNVCYRDKLLDKPKELWVSEADSLIVNNKGDSARQMGKKFNFTALYLATPQTFSTLLFVPLETAEGWVSNFKALYSGYYSWAMKVGKVAEVRGYARTSWIERQRWVADGNAKGAGDSPLRNGVNHLIQGECANQMKSAWVRIADEVIGTKVEFLPPVHDEANFLVPGEYYLDIDKSEWKGDLLVKPYYTFSEEAVYWKQTISKIMEDVQTECFQSMNSPVTGAVDANLAPYWKH